VGVRLTTSAYRRALDFLFARTTGQWKLGLERVEAFLSELGDPHRRLRTLHVAGTNGKGSVCAALETVLRARGLRVAKYTSPHLVDFRERFLVDGAPVPEDAIVAFLDRWTPAVERLGATFFEATTAMAFQLFAESDVDIAVIETGLGGRLDATNVLTPLVAGVTGIAVDHTEWLGTSRETIAPEKAGIYKPGIPAVVGEPDPEIRALLASEATRHGASPIRIVAEEGRAEGVRVDATGTSFEWVRGRERLAVTTGLPGRHQATNAMVALTMLDALPGEHRVAPAGAIPALAGVRLPGRFSRHGPWIFDVAHNPDGAAVTAETLLAVSPVRPAVALMSVLGDKDWRGMMAALAPVVDGFVFTNAPTAPASRAWSAGEALEYARARGWSAELVPDFDRALALAPARGATVLVTGSFHTVGDAMARLQVSPTTG
jgi:dihydrofolate synthase / folylpolyglutamate synthase